MSNLRKRMTEDMKLRGLSPRTQDVYLSQIKKFAEYYGRSPEHLSEEELRKYFFYVTEELKVSDSFFKQSISSIKFLYTVTLDRNWKTLNIIRPPKRKRLPVVLSKEEVKKILDVPTNLKHRAILAVIYSGGLRVSEVCILRVGNIDSNRMQIRIVQAKGNKDRYTILGKKTLILLREYWRSCHPSRSKGAKVGREEWLFPGQISFKPLSIATVQRIFYHACEKSGIKKKVSVHNLRHSFATHLMEAGVNLRYIQALLGHKSPKATSIYTHVCRQDITKIVSPIDTL